MKNVKKVQSTEQTKRIPKWEFGKVFEEIANDYKSHLAEDACETANEIFETAGRLYHAVDESNLDDAAKVYFMDLLTIISDDAGYLYEVLQ